MVYYLSPVSNVWGPRRKLQTCHNCKTRSYKRTLPQILLPGNRISCQQRKAFILQSRKVSKSCLEVLVREKTP